MTLYDISSLLGVSPALLAVIIVWSLIWKGIALWISARKKHTIWFIVMLGVNTIGILEILYIFIFSKMSLSKPAARVTAKPKRKKK